MHHVGVNTWETLALKAFCETAAEIGKMPLLSGNFGVGVFMHSLENPSNV